MKRQDVMLETERLIERWRLGGAKPTVAALAAACGITRQAIYRSHRSALEKIQESNAASWKADSRSAKAELKLELLRDRHRREVERVRMLTTLCGELAAALADTKTELADARAVIERLKQRVPPVRA